MAVLLMSLDDRGKCAFDAATETVKQLLALATASIGGVIVLFDDKDKPGIEFGSAACAVDASLCLLGLSVVLGLLALGALAGQLGSDKISAPSTYAPTVRLMTAGQMFLYGLGIVVAIFAVI
jgi:hypothetical protein